MIFWYMQYRFEVSVEQIIVIIVLGRFWSTLTSWAWTSLTSWTSSLVAWRNLRSHLDISIGQSLEKKICSPLFVLITGKICLSSFNFRKSKLHKLLKWINTLLMACSSDWEMRIVPGGACWPCPPCPPGISGASPPSSSSSPWIILSNSSGCWEISYFIREILDRVEDDSDQFAVRLE